MQKARAKISWLPYAVLIFSIVALSMSAILVRFANAPGPVNGFYRTLTATTLMVIPFAIQSKRSSQTRPVTLRAAAMAAMAGFFFAINLAAWNTGALMTAAANVTLLGNTSVIWVPLAGLLLFNERLRVEFWIGLAVALVGAIIILGQDLLSHADLGLGDALGLFASVAYTVYILMMERARTKLSALVAWWFSTAASCVTLLAITLMLRQPLSGYEIYSYVIFVVMALVIQISGFLSMNFVLGFLPASLISTSMLLQPVLTAIFAVPMLGQGIGMVQALGSVLVLGGLIIVHLSRNRSIRLKTDRTRSTAD
ncbi:MAG: DMT family transporter [Chloroflexi bacterium]|nr:DMT family transporter [Chloroflexota bacterium]